MSDIQLQCPERFNHLFCRTEQKTVPFCRAVLQPTKMSTCLHCPDGMVLRYVRCFKWRAYYMGLLVKREIALNISVEN